MSDNHILQGYFIAEGMQKKVFCKTASLKTLQNPQVNTSHRLPVLVTLQAMTANILKKIPIAYVFLIFLRNFNSFSKEHFSVRQTTISSLER